MSLVPNERRVLAAIESALRGTDPALATMLETFSTPVSHAPPRVWLRLPWRRIRISVAVALILAAFSSLICCGLLIKTPQPPRCPPPSASGSAVYRPVTCAPADGGLPPASPPGGIGLPGAPGLQP